MGQLAGRHTQRMLVGREVGKAAASGVHVYTEPR